MRYVVAVVQVATGMLFKFLATKCYYYKLKFCVYKNNVLCLEGTFRLIVLNENVL